jgi:hypothetical protein
MSVAMRNNLIVIPWKYKTQIDHNTDVIVGRKEKSLPV